MSRKRAPITLAGQLGVPNQYRQQHSNFDMEQLAVGVVDGGVVRSQVRSLLTMPETRRELIAIAIADLRNRGKFDSSDAIKIKDTALDRLLFPVEHEAICWFIKIHAKVEGKGGSITNYLGESRSTDVHKSPYSDNEGQDRKLHAYVSNRLPEPFLAFLDWLTWHEFPGFRDGSPTDQIEIGKEIIDSKDARRATGGLEGFLRAVAQTIAHWRAEGQTLTRRNQELLKIQFDHKKKKHYG